MPPATLTLDGTSLDLRDLEPLARGDDVALALSDGARNAVERARAQVERTIASGATVYGLTTGFGRLKSVAIGREDLVELQRNLVLSHCCGVGEPMPPEEVRVMQVLRINGLARGHSGVRLGTLEQAVRLFNARFVPIVPQQGSVGASGDLAPLAQLAAAAMGHGRVWLAGEEMSAREALGRLGEAPLEPQAKEGLALINGTECMKATGSLVALRARNLSKVADIAAAWTIEALLGSARPFDARLAALKGHAGHARTSANVRLLLEGSDVLASHADCGRVQDPYSLRCVPQIHGAFKAALEHVEAILAGELNAVTDNPILFPDTGEVVSAGQFHGQPVSIVLDYLGLALCTLANVSERRIEQLVNPDLSSLPAFLTPEPGLNSGLMMAQVTAAALASENKVHAHPASVDSVPTSANQEDHVSMGVTAARKARTIAANVEHVLAIELLAAGQAREFRRDLAAGPGIEAAQAALREVVPPLRRDRYLRDDIAAVHDLVASGRLVARVEARLGRELEA